MPLNFTNYKVITEPKKPVETKPAETPIQEFKEKIQEFKSRKASNDIVLTEKEFDEYTNRIASIFTGHVELPKDFPDENFYREKYLEMLDKEQKRINDKADNLAKIYEEIKITPNPPLLPTDELSMTDSIPALVRQGAYYKTLSKKNETKKPVKVKILKTVKKKTLTKPKI